MARVLCGRVLLLQQVLVGRTVSRELGRVLDPEGRRGLVSSLLTFGRVGHKWGEDRPEGRAPPHRQPPQAV